MVLVDGQYLAEPVELHLGLARRAAGVAGHRGDDLLDGALGVARGADRRGRLKEDQRR